MFKKFIIIGLLLMIFFAIVVNSMKNGSPASSGDFGYIAAILEGGSHLCSGIIINERHILTIAHMIIHISVQHLGVIVQMISFTPSRCYPQKLNNVYIHPNLKIRHSDSHDLYYDNDIALLRLQRPFQLSPPFALAPLNNPKYDDDNCSTCILISWQVPNNRKRTLFLAWELIVLINNQSYENSTHYLGQHEQFFGDIFGTAIIRDVDIGSPIVCGNSIRGLVVHGERLRILGRPSIMTSIAPHMGFIEEISKNGLFDVEEEKYPYVVSIWFGDIYVCGGFIIDAIHIGTAGHCATNKRAIEYTVKMGHSAEGVQELSIAHIMIHPDYKVETSHESSMSYIDHDFAILTASIILAGSISWSEGIRPITLPESDDDFHEGQICEILRWKYNIDFISEKDKIQLMSSRVVLMDGYCQLQIDPSTQFDVPSFWGKTQYGMPIADVKDVGNPIICNGHPVGFLIQAIPFENDLPAKVAKFLKIRPYIEFSTNIVNENS